MKIIIIGAGASGIVAAINYKRNHKSDDVLVIEQLAAPLKKLLASGNGKCNLGNSNIDFSNYNNPEFAKKIISDYDSDLSFNISAGKEWWVNNELGVGVALSFNHSSAKSKLFDYEGKASFNSLSVVATVTFN